MGRREIYKKCPCIYYFAKGRRQIIDKPAEINLQNKGKIFWKTKEKTKNKGKKQAPSAVRQAAICFNKNILRNFLNCDKIFLVLEMYLRR